MVNIEEHLRILDYYKTQIEQTLSSPCVEEYHQCSLFVDDLRNWVECLSDIPQSILLKSSLNECATADLFCIHGLYKHAIISLRLCLEHCLFAIYLSSNDFYFRRWKDGKEDMKWALITDESLGIFSKSFIRAYAPEFESRSAELLGIACNVYRECSEFVHGNYSKINSLPGYNEFNQDMFSEYIRLFQSIAYLLSIALVIRFKEYITSHDMLGKLEIGIMHNIDMLPEIQLLYNKFGGEGL